MGSPLTEAEETPEPKQAPSKGMRRWVFWLRTCYVVCLMPLFFVLAAGVMIVERDISAPSWIVSRVEARAAELLNGGELRFGAISMRIGKDLHPTVRLIDTQLYDESGLTITRIPVVEGLISPRGLALRQEVLLQDIHLTGAQINVRRAADGALEVAFGQGTSAVGQARSLPDFLDQADAVFERPALEALETVRIDGLIVNFDDARAGRSWIVDGGQLSLDLRDGETFLRGDMSLLSGRAEVTTVNLSYRSPRGSREAELGLNIADAAASDIAAQSPALTWLRGIEAPITAALRTELDVDGALGPLNATLEIGQGVLQPNTATRPVRFDAAKTYLTYDPARDRISFSQIEVDTEWGQLQATGEAYLREIRDGLPRALLGQFQFRDVAVNPAGLYETDLLLPAAAVDLRLRFDPFRIEIGQMVLNDGTSRLSSSGEITATDAGWQLALDASIDEIAPDKVLAIWPETIKPGTRRWVENNITNARLFDVQAGLRLHPERALQLAAEFEFDAATVRFMRHMPPITGGEGTGSYIDGAFVVSLDEGVVAAPQGGPMQLAGSVFTIPESRMRNAPASVDLRASSSVTAALSILNQRPFEFLDKANRPVTLADGRAEVSGRIDMRLKRRITNADVEFDMQADLRSVRSDTLVPGRQLAAARLQVDATREGLTISGPMRIGAVAMNGQWRQQFAPDARDRSQVQATVELSEAFIDEFDIALPPSSVSGVGEGELTIDLAKGQPPSFTLTSDLKGVRLAVPPIGWAKPPGVAGELLLEGTLGPVPEITNVFVRGGGLRAQGRVTLAEGGQLVAAVFDELRVEDWLNAPLTLRGRGQGAPAGVEIAGGRLDLRRARFGASGGDGGPVQIALDRLQVTEGIALTGFSGNFSGAGGFSGQFRARVNDEAVVQGTVAPRNGRSAVRLVSDDAGGVLRAAGFMRNAGDGSLDLTLLPAGGEGTFDGTLAIRGLRVRDAPTIAALLDAISVVGLLQQMDGQGLAFDEVFARFRLSPEQIVVTEASAIGPGLGISLDGIYTLASKRMDFQGVVSPFFLVNSIGSILTRRGEGLIGFNFNIGGSVDAPQVTVNPLSALTPGMFREIFRRPPPELTQ